MFSEVLVNYFVLVHQVDSANLTEEGNNEIEYPKI